MTRLRKVVDEHIECIVAPVPGFACAAAAQLMDPDYSVNRRTGERSYAPQHYVGVLSYLPELQLPAGKANLARYMWNVMAMDTAARGNTSGGAACDPFTQPCPEDQVPCTLCASVMGGGAWSRWLKGEGVYEKTDTEGCCAA